MGAAERALEQAAQQDFIAFQDTPAHGAEPVPFPTKAVNAAANVHKAVVTAVKRRKRHSAHPLRARQRRRTHQARLPFAGFAFAAALALAAGNLCGTALAIFPFE